MTVSVSGSPDRPVSRSPRSSRQARRLRRHQSLGDLAVWAVLTSGLLALLVAVTFAWPPFKRILLLAGFSVLLSYLLAPLVDWLRQHVHPGTTTLSGPVAVALTYVLIAVLGLTGWAMATPWLRGVAFDVTTDTRHLLHTTTAKVRAIDGGVLVGLGVPPPVSDHLATGLSAVTGQVEHHAETAIDEVAEHAPYFRWFGLAPLIAFVLLIDWRGFGRTAVRAVPAGHLRWRAVEFLGHVNSVLAGYTRAQLLSCAFIGVTCTVGFALIGVPYWFALGMLAGLMEFLPLIGPLAVALVAASMVSGFPLITLLGFLGLLRLVQDYVVYPRFAGHHMHLHPVAVVAAVIVGGNVLGLAGVLCAVPLVGILSVTHRHYREYRELEEFLRENRRDTLAGGTAGTAGRSTVAAGAGAAPLPVDTAPTAPTIAAAATGGGAAASATAGAETPTDGEAAPGGAASAAPPGNDA